MVGGVATFGDVPELTAKIIKNKIADLIYNRNIEPRRTTEFLFKTTAHYGQRGIVVSAISGIEIALWDLLGRKAEVSVANL